MTAVAWALTRTAPGEDETLVADIRRLSELDALREAAAGARAALSASVDDVADGAARPLGGQPSGDEDEQGGYQPRKEIDGPGP